MTPQLMVCLRICRKQFLMERFIGSDDIFALVREGSFTYSSGGAQYTAQSGDGVLFRKNVLYQRKVLSPVTMYFFRFRSDEPVFTAEHIRFRDQNRIRSTLAMLEQLDKGVHKEDFELRKHLFADLIAQYRLESGLLSGGGGKPDQRIEQAVTYIHNNLHRKLALSNVAGKTGLSYVQFLRRFRGAVGVTPQEYVAGLRLQKAKALLTDTDMPVREIAAACGFENEYYFSNFFKKNSGMSPSAFRKNST